MNSSTRPLWTRSAWTTGSCSRVSEPNALGRLTEYATVLSSGCFSLCSSGGDFRDGYLRAKFKSDNIDRLHHGYWGYSEDAYTTYKNLFTVSGDIVIESDRIKMCLHPP